ncbi:hypothetical protein H2248_011347 [Termitomyces sp. 'cryptogamus']|nr:hypothetical protein H2248_011347 [Termitomyces sp. 'cryptogamus']
MDDVSSKRRSQLRIRTKGRMISHFRGFRRRLVDLVAIIALCLIIQRLFHFGLFRLSFDSANADNRREGSKLTTCERVGRPDDETPISAHHVYSPNGLLHVNPDGIHPVLALIRRAEDEWDRKLDRASRTLEEAVREYKRRYRRDPPAGFDDWWDFAQEMEDRLPDEYDSISRELEPFWGMDPVDLAKIQAELETRVDTFTILKTSTNDTNLVATSFSDPENWERNDLLRGLKETLDLLDPVEPALRPFRAVFSPYPEPRLLSDYNVKKTFLDAAAAGKYVNLTKLPKIHNLGFTSACPPGTPGRSKNYTSDFTYHPNVRTERTFIYDHRLSMDPCQNPRLFDYHTHYVSKSEGISPQPNLVPQFSYSTTSLYHDIQTPSLFGLTLGPSLEDDPEWEDKKDERLRWRGSNIGMVNSEKTRWRDAHHSRLISLATDLNGTANVLIPGRVEDEGWWRVGGGTMVKKSLLNPSMLDVAFVGDPMGCDIQFCRYMETQFEWRKKRELQDTDAGKYKYILDIDAKGPSTEFKRLMSSNSLVFKATAYPEWWLGRSQPWVHYVPIQVDYSDLYDTLLFFRGGLYGEDNHDHLAKRIAYQGKEWSKTFWREEDMTVYLFRLFLEYSRVMSLDRDSMSYRLGTPD